MARGFSIRNVSTNTNLYGTRPTGNAVNMLPSWERCSMKLRKAHETTYLRDTGARWPMAHLRVLPGVPYKRRNPSYGYGHIQLAQRRGGRALLCFLLVV